MNQLRIDQDKCSLCGTCEISLPDLLTKAKGGVLFISDGNIRAHVVDIFRAVNSCQNGALSLGVIR